MNADDVGPSMANRLTFELSNSRFRDMAKRLALSILLLGTMAQTAIADWHHHHTSHSDLSNDPHFDAFMWSAVLAIAATMLLCFFGGPILILWGRRIRDTLWIVPLANLLLYTLSIALRSYPGGLAARLQPPGVYYTSAEIVFVLVLSFAVAIVIAAVQWVVRKMRLLLRKRESIAKPAGKLEPSITAVFADESLPPIRR